MHKIINSLQKNSGLSEKESSVYTALLEIGEGTVIDISKKSGIKRSTVYNLLPNLTRSGLVKTTFKNKKKFFFIEDVSKLELVLKEKQNKIKNLIPELEAIHNILPNKPKITYFEGEGGLKELYWDTLNSSKEGEIIYSYTGMENFDEIFPKDFADEYIAERIKRKRRSRVIAPRSKASLAWTKDASQKLREIKLVNKPLEFKADIQIYANKVALITYVPDFVGVIIESKEINELQKSTFKIMWDLLPN